MSDFDKRNYIRYPAEQDELVTIYYLDESNKKTGQRMGLGQNESFKGFLCCFCGRSKFQTRAGSFLRIRHSSKNESQSGLDQKAGRPDHQGRILHDRLNCPGLFGIRRIRQASVFPITNCGISERILNGIIP